MSTTYRIIEDRAAFGALRADWNDLVRASDQDHVFMRHEWFCAWWDNLPHGGELCVMTAWEGDRLVAAAPTMKRRERRRGASFTVLSLMVSGITPRCHLLVRAGTDPHVAFAGLEAVADWDVAEFKQVDADAPLTAALRRWLDRRGGAVFEDGALSPYGILPGTWKEFEKAHTKSFRKRFRNAMNRCRTAEGFAVERIETFAAFEDRFADVLAVSRNSWKREGGSDLDSQRGMAEFFRTLARELEREGLWVLHMLRIEGKPVAIGFAVRHARRMVLLRWDFDDDFRYYMPGVVVHIHAIEDLMRQGPGCEYDLSGTATEFKSGLVDGVRRHVDITFGSRGLRANVLMLGKRALDGARRLVRDPAPAAAP